jgi:hypothetical protein
MRRTEGKEAVMTDEHFMRQWTDGHECFSADVDKGLAKLRRIIDAAYGVPATGGAPRTTEAMLAGLAATAVTVVVFASTVMVTTAGIPLA